MSGSFRLAQRSLTKQGFSNSAWLLHWKIVESLPSMDLVRFFPLRRSLRMDSFCSHSCQRPFASKSKLRFLTIAAQLECEPFRAKCCLNGWMSYIVFLFSKFHLFCTRRLLSVPTTFHPPMPAKIAGHGKDGCERSQNQGFAAKSRISQYLLGRRCWSRFWRSIPVFSRF